MREIIKKVKAWAYDRNLHIPWKDKDGVLQQFKKLYEECNELLEACDPAINDTAEQKDAIGDIQVVLIVMCEQLGHDYDQCLEDAYKVIKDRKGKMIDGVFVKDE